MLFLAFASISLVKNKKFQALVKFHMFLTQISDVCSFECL